MADGIFLVSVIIFGTGGDKQKKQKQAEKIIHFRLLLILYAPD